MLFDSTLLRNVLFLYKNNCGFSYIFLKYTHSLLYIVWECTLVVYTTYNVSAFGGSNLIGF